MKKPFTIADITVIDTPFTIEDLDRALDYPTIWIEQVLIKPGEFNRTRRFIVYGDQYKIEWWCNLSFLTTGDLIVPFEYVKQSNTWPHPSRMNLQFYCSGSSSPCCILLIER